MTLISSKFKKFFSLSDNKIIEKETILSEWRLERMNEWMKNDEADWVVESKSWYKSGRCLE